MSHGIAKDAPILSVVLNWNGANTLYDTLRDLSKQTATPHRILVIDNASSDGSVDKLSQDFPEVDLLRLDKNYRFAGGNNAVLQWDGWKEVDWKNGWLFFSNNDVLYKHEILEELRLVGQQKLDTISVSPWIAYGEGAERDYLWFGGAQLNSYGWWGHLQIRKPYLGREDGKVVTTDYATACSVLIPAKYFFEVHGFDTGFPHYVEDADLSLRLKEKFNGQCYLVQKTLAFHRVSSSMGGSAEKYSLITASQIKLLKRHYRNKFVGYVGIWFHNCAMAFRRKGFSGIIAVCKGWWEGMRNRPIVWEQPR